MNKALHKKVVLVLSLAYIFIFIFFLQAIIHILISYMKNLYLDFSLLNYSQINPTYLEITKDILEKINYAEKMRCFFSFPESFINCSNVFCYESVYFLRHIINVFFILFFVKYILIRNIFSYHGLNKFKWNELFKNTWLPVLSFTLFIYFAGTFTSQPDISQQVGVSFKNPYVWLRSLILMPIIEEILFRGFLYQFIKEILLKTTLNYKYSALGAACLQSIFWCLTHLQYTEFLAFLIIFTTGCLLAYIREKNKSIYPCMFYHGLLNALTNILSMLIK